MPRGRRPHLPRSYPETPTARRAPLPQRLELAPRAAARAGVSDGQSWTSTASRRSTPQTSGWPRRRRGSAHRLHRAPTPWSGRRIREPADRSSPRHPRTPEPCRGGDPGGSRPPASASDGLVTRAAPCVGHPVVQPPLGGTQDHRLHRPPREVVRLGPKAIRPRGPPAVSLFDGSSILITGGTGSFGKAFLSSSSSSRPRACRHLLARRAQAVRDAADLR